MLEGASCNCFLTCYLWAINAIQTNISCNTNTSSQNKVNTNQSTRWLISEIEHSCSINQKYDTADVSTTTRCSIAGIKQFTFNNYHQHRLWKNCMQFNKIKNTGIENLATIGLLQ